MANVELVESEVWTKMFELPKVNRSIADRREFELLEKGSQSNIALGQQNLIFETDDTNTFNDLNSFHLETRWKILKKVLGTDYSANALITLISSGAALFARARLFLNDVMIESNNYSDIRGLLLDILQEKKDDQASQAQSWFYPETYEDFRGECTMTNLSSLARLERHIGIFPPSVVPVRNPSNEVQLWIPLSKLFGYVRDNAGAVISQRIRVELDLPDTGKGLIKTNTQIVTPGTDDVVDGTVRMMYCSLWGWKVKPSDTIKQEILQKLNSGTKHTQMWSQHDVYQCGDVVDSGGSQQLKIANKYATLGRVYIFAMALPKTRGVQTYNAGMMDPVLFKNANLIMNSENYPAKPYNIDFNQNRYQRLYKAFLDSSEAGEYDCDTYYDFDTFRASPILCFDLNSPGQGVYDQSSQADLLVTFTYDDSPVANAYGVDAVSADDKKYRIYAVVETYRSVTIDMRDGYMHFTSVSA